MNYIPDMKVFRAYRETSEYKTSVKFVAEAIRSPRVLSLNVLVFN